MRQSLVLHPACETSPVRAIQVDVERPGRDSLLFRFTVEGDRERIRMPDLGPPERADDLWRHTCCEAFLGLGGGAYAEFNFSPSHGWAAYHFHAVRQGMKPLQLERPAQIAMAPRDNGFVLTATVSGDTVPNGPAPLGLTAVIEAMDGTMSYWALAHPAPKPDFHDPEGFVARLPVVEHP